mmetsp:Transcript_94276/g.215663  ORF Transcript_94276/g.215663 Transcript_94276/m.215663 type:complete len:366 (+) Transcript_94276:568-1665(+)
MEQACARLLPARGCPALRRPHRHPTKNAFHPQQPGAAARMAFQKSPRQRARATGLRPRPALADSGWGDARPPAQTGPQLAPVPLPCWQQNFETAPVLLPLFESRGTKLAFPLLRLHDRRQQPNQKRRLEAIPARKKPHSQSQRTRICCGWSGGPSSLDWCPQPPQHGCSPTRLATRSRPLLPQGPLALQPQRTEDRENCEKALQSMEAGENTTQMRICHLGTFAPHADYRPRTCHSPCTQHAPENELDRPLSSVGRCPHDPKLPDTCPTSEQRRPRGAAGANGNTMPQRLLGLCEPMTSTHQPLVWPALRAESQGLPSPATDTTHRTTHEGKQSRPRETTTNHEAHPASPSPCRGRAGIHSQQTN